jgi:Domain of Unknown Function (DUF1080)
MTMKRALLPTVAILGAFWAMAGCSAASESSAPPPNSDGGNPKSGGDGGSAAPGAGSTGGREDGAASGGLGTMDGSASDDGSDAPSGTSSESSDGGETDAGGVVDAGRVSVDSGDATTRDAGVSPSDAGSGLVSIFDGTTLSGWIQVPAASWSIVGGAMHSQGTARGYIYTTESFGDFRFVFTSRLVLDPANHLPCVLFWGNSFGVDALAAIQVQPPRGYMWDYRTTGPTANASPNIFETRLAQPGLAPTQWSQCEMLANRAGGSMRFACCALTGANTRCKGIEIVDFKDPTAGKTAPLALQVHNAGMIEEFKNLSVEAPVADPTTLLTTQWP